ncbi:MAG: rhomboid family intramembrane serine protease [Verrucomicrobia bacterium]|nr:rhomboid family intramembrane serine protease [Verrucomicrobiota bacterium]
MRAIGQLPDQASAQIFGDYLLVQGLHNQVDPDENGHWTVWIHDDDHLDQARSLLTEFLQQPNSAKYVQAAPKARGLREKEQQEELTWRKRFFNRRSDWGDSQIRVGALTAALMAASLAVALISVASGAEHPLIKSLFITDYTVADGMVSFRPGLPEIRSGQLWRLFTPIFIHFGLMHIVFNMLCLVNLGSLIEARLGLGKLAKLVVVIAALSNLGQYYVGGPAFGGMSGVVYGLFGYAWLRGKLDPHSGLFVDSTSVVMMVGWFFLGMTGWVGPIANMAHAAGFGLGLVWGFLAAKFAPGE